MDDVTSDARPQLPPDDEVARQLAKLLDDVRATVGDSTVVTVDSYEDGWIRVTSLESVDGFGCPVSWSELGDDQLILAIGRVGCRWELIRNTNDTQFLQGIVRSVVAGRVSEVFGPGRSEVTVTLDDGTTERTSVGQALRGCLPAPFWPRWGRRVQYPPYRR